MRKKEKRQITNNRNKWEGKNHTENVIRKYYKYFTVINLITNTIEQLLE